MNLSDILFYAAMVSGLTVIPLVVGLASIRLDRRDQALRLAARRDRRPLA